MGDSTFVGGLRVPERGYDVASLLQEAREDGYDFISTKLPYSSSAQKRTDLTLIESKWWSTSIVGEVSSPAFYLRQNSRGNSDQSDLFMSDAMATPNPTMESDNGDALVQTLCQENETAASLAKDHLAFMLDWAGHMNIPAVILPSIPKLNARQYINFLASQCLKCSSNNVQLWIRVPFSNEGLQSYRELHKACDTPANIGCMISFDERNKITPDTLGKSLVLLHQFSGSNLRALCFNTNVFLTNKKGYPTLSKANQISFIESMKRLGRTLRVLVEGFPLHHDETCSVNVKGKSRYLSYLQYLRHLRSTQEVTSILDTDESRMELSYLDHLQSALQPCFDNLEFATYEVFERDPVKYVRYREAVEYALLDKIQLGQLIIESNPNQPNQSIFHPLIFVVGAGRGPLVKASLEAVSNINKNEGRLQGFIIAPKIIAVEKNPSAVLYLHSMKCREASWVSVDIVECDMRCANENEVLSRIISGHESERADIIVSELLGSFGDNEVSPECLDGVQRCGLMKENCVSIPQSYTSYLAPTTSMRLYSESQAQAYQPSNPMEGPAGKPCGNLHAMETPYVVRTHAAAQTHKELPCWTFRHPNKKTGMSIDEAAKNVNNERHAQLLFSDTLFSSVGYRSGYGHVDRNIAKIALSSPNNTDSENFTYTLHGFLGTFHCLLYESFQKKSITISIAPNSFSVGMYSWFPLYFPLREPLTVPTGATVRCNIWRKSNKVGPSQGGGKVWYEWYAEVIDKATGQIIGASNTHNPEGRSSSVLL